MNYSRRRGMAPRAIPNPRPGRGKSIDPEELFPGVIDEVDYPEKSSRPISIRRISLVPAPIS